MNKKRLSVVMAGAMLASSVAPVMRSRSNNRSNKSKCKRIRIITGRSKKPSRKKCIR